MSVNYICNYRGSCCCRVMPSGKSKDIGDYISQATEVPKRKLEEVPAESHCQQGALPEME